MKSQGQKPYCGADTQLIETFLGLEENNFLFLAQAVG